MGRAIIHVVVVLVLVGSMLASYSAHMSGSLPAALGVEEVWSLAIPGASHVAAWGEGDAYAIAIGSSGEVIVYSMRGKLVSRVAQGMQVYKLSWSSSGDLLYVVKGSESSKAIILTQEGTIYRRWLSDNPLCGSAGWLPLSHDVAYAGYRSLGTERGSRLGGRDVDARFVPHACFLDVTGIVAGGREYLLVAGVSLDSPGLLHLWVVDPESLKPRAHLVVSENASVVGVRLQPFTVNFQTSYTTIVLVVAVTAVDSWHVMMVVPQPEEGRIARIFDLRLRGFQAPAPAEVGDGMLYVLRGDGVLMVYNIVPVTSSIVEVRGLINISLPVSPSESLYALSYDGRHGLLLVVDSKGIIHAYRPRALTTIYIVTSTRTLTVREVEYSTTTTTTTLTETKTIVRYETTTTTATTTTTLVRTLTRTKTTTKTLVETVSFTVTTTKEVTTTKTRTVTRYETVTRTKTSTVTHTTTTTQTLYKTRTIIVYSLTPVTSIVFLATPTTTEASRSTTTHPKTLESTRTHTETAPATTLLQAQASITKPQKPPGPSLPVVLSVAVVAAIVLLPVFYMWRRRI